MISNQLGHIVTLQLSDKPMAVLPGFGGFVKDHVGAELDELRNRIHPPKNTVVFNARLVHNDGLLVASISAESDITYAEADAWLTDAITELRFRLDNADVVSWEHLGQLRKNEAGAIEFEAVESATLQEEFFGLKPVSLRPVEKTNADKVRELVAADGPVATTVKTLPIKKFVGYAAAAVAVGVLMWMPIQNGALNNGKMLVHQLNPFGTNSHMAYSGREFNETWLTKGFERKDALSSQFEHTYINLYLTKGAQKPIVVRTDAIPSTEVDAGEIIPEASEPEVASSYLVIAATFKTKTQAADYVANMIKRGFSAQYAGKDQSGHLVAYGRYDSKVDAEKMLSSVSLSNKEARIVSGI